MSQSRESKSFGRLSLAASERLALMNEERICWAVIFCTAKFFQIDWAPKRKDAWRLAIRGHRKGTLECF
ncbi:hypothetical protein AHiyo1_25250 [Arthrobacter sp. Hiyo1]|nr:hypothetical protein AHiyo1_25250 [Arthrobacter sp. Hiyo1]